MAKVHWLGGAQYSPTPHCCLDDGLISDWVSPDLDQHPARAEHPRAASYSAWVSGGSAREYLAAGMEYCLYYGKCVWLLDYGGTPGGYQAVEGASKQGAQPCPMMMHTRNQKLTSAQCSTSVGPRSATLAQHWYGIVGFLHRPHVHYYPQDTTTTSHRKMANESWKIRWWMLSHNHIDQTPCQGALWSSRWNTRVMYLPGHTHEDRTGLTITSAGIDFRWRP